MVCQIDGEIRRAQKMHGKAHHQPHSYHIEYCVSFFPLNLKFMRKKIWLQNLCANTLFPLPTAIKLYN